MPRATVAKLRSIPISTTVPGTNELLAYDGSEWTPTDTPHVQNITILNAPSTATDGTNKQYVDGLIAGVSWKTLCTAASTATLTATYNNGTGGVGATLTNTGAQVALVLDGITLATQDRVLIKNQSSQIENGIYIVTDTGSPSTDWILTRALDADGSPSGELNYATTFIEEGTTQSGSGWTQTTLNPTIGTSPIVWVQFLGPIVTTWSGGSTGLTPSTPTSGPITLGGTLNIASGGTNASATPTAGAIAYGTGTQYGFTAAGTTGQVLTSAGTGTPTWTDPNAETSTVTTLSTGIVRPLFVTGTGDVPLYINSAEYQLNAATGALQLGSAGIAIGEVGAAASTSVAGSIAIGASSVNDGGNCISIGPNTISAGVVNYQVIGFTNNITSGNGGIVLGNNCINDGSNSISIGQGASATSGNTIAIGQGATSTFNNLAIGLGATSNGATTIAIGLGANCSQSNATAIGPSANCSSNFGVALGDGAISSGNFNSIAIGNSDATNNGSISIGVSAISSGSSGVAIGSSSIANSSDGVAIGNGASTNAIANAIAIGPSAIPSSASFALAISTNASSVTPAVLGTTLNGNTFQIEKYSQLYQTTATAAGTTTLTVTSAQKQYFTGTQIQTVVMPVTSTLALGFEFKIYNNSTGTLTIQSSGLNTITTLGQNEFAFLTCILTSGTTAASWSFVSSDQNITTLNTGTLFPTFVAGTGRQPVRINSAQFAINAATGALQLGSTGIAIGRVGGTASATFLESISLGSGANSTGTSSLSLGRNATANNDALAVGFGATAGAGSTIAIGPGAIVSGAISIAIGNSATSTTTSAISIGRSASTTQPDSIAIGYLATSSGSNAIAIGSPATANSSTGIAIGNSATCSGASSVALGASAICASSSGIAIGNSARTGTGGSNIIMGPSAGSSTKTGASNIVIGSSAANIGTSSWTAQIYPQTSGSWLGDTRITFDGQIDPQGVFIGSTVGSSTTLTISTAVTNLIVLGMPIYGTGIGSGVFISAFGTGTGGTGTYITSAAVNIPTINTTSVTSLAISTGSKSLTVGTGLAYVAGQYVLIQNTIANYMHGVITSYVSGTGALVVSVSRTLGSGTFASWTVDLDILTDTILTVTVAPTAPATIFELSPITGTGVAANTQIIKFISGVANTVGATYTVDNSQTVASTTITASYSNVLNVTTATTGSLVVGMLITQSGGSAYDLLYITALGTGTGGTGTYVLNIPIISNAGTAIVTAPTMQLNSAVTGNLAFGATGTGFTGTIVKLISGTQGAINSTYQMSNNQTVAASTAMTITNASATNITIGPSSMQRALASNNIVLGNSAAQFLETGVTNTIIGTSANLDRSTSNTVIIGGSAGGQYSQNSTSVILGNEACNGSCTFNGNITLAFTGNGDTGGISSTTLTITTVTTNRLVLGMRISGTGITAGTFINALGTGTGGLGTYTLSTAATITPGTAITGVTTLTLTSTPSGTFKLGMTIVGSNTGFGTTYVQELTRGSLGANGSTYFITTPAVNQNGGTGSFIGYSQAANAVAIGYQSLARSNSISIGRGSSTLTDNSIAIGYQSINNGTNCISLGVNTISTAMQNAQIVGFSNNAVSGNGSIMLGNTNTANSINSIIIGQSSSTIAGGATSIAIGSSSVGGTNSLSIGPNSTTSGGNGAIAIGASATSTSTNSIAIGSSTTSTSTNTIAIGPLCSATSGSNIVAIGNTCISTVSTTVAIGVSNTTHGANSVAIGSTLNTGTGSNNIILGNTSGSATATGADNIVIGRTAKQLGTASWTAQIFPQLTGTWQANTLLTFSGNINPAGIFIGSTAGVSTTLTVTSAVQNAIFVGMPIYYFTGTIPGVYISAFGTGTGGAGTYTVNTAITIPAVSTSSITSLTIGTGSQTLTVGTGLAFAPGQYAVIVNSPTNYMQGVVQSYVSGTGVLVVIVDKIAGSGTFASWTVDRSFITETIMTVTTAPTSPGVIYELSPITGAGVTAGTQLTRLTSDIANTIGATYAVDTSQTVATTTITATQSTLLTVTTATTGTLNAGTAITSVGGVAQSGLIITALGTGAGGTGTYVLSAPIIAPALSAIQIASTMVLNSAATGSLTFGSTGTGFSGTITRLTLGTSGALNSVYQMSTNQTVAASTAMTITNPAAGTVGIGLSALQRIVASNNIGLGNSVGTSLESGSGNILIGSSSNAERTTTNSVIIGTSAGGANVKSGGAVIEGASACNSSGTVSGAIWLGFVGTGYTLGGTGTTLIIDSVTSNALVAGMPISGTGIAYGTYITNTSSNGSGGIGAYVLSASATIPFGTTITGTDIFRTTSAVTGTTLVRGASLSGSTITASSMYIKDIVVQFSGSSIAYTFTATGPVTNMPVSTITYGVEPTNAVSLGQSSSASANSISIGSAALSLPNATTIGTSLSNIVPNTTQIGNNSLETFRILDPATGGFTNRNVKTTSASASITLTPIIALGGYLDATAAGAITITLDTGANFDNNTQLMGNLYVGLSFKTVIVSSDATGQITYTPSTGITLKGNLVAATNSAQTLMFYRTGTDTWDVIIGV